MGDPGTDIRFGAGGDPGAFSGFLTGDRERDSRNVGILLQTIAAVNSSLELESLIVRVVDLTLELTGAEQGILLLYEDGELRIRTARNRDGRTLGSDIKYSRSVPASVAKEGRAYFHRDKFDASVSMKSFQLLTVMCVPLRVQERVLGVLYVDSHDATRLFEEKSDLILLEALAYQAAIALDNARLLEHYVEKKRIQEGLLVAREIQRRLLPGGPLAVPGFDIHGASVGCEETSGDYFDYIRARDERVGLVVGDVAGHGVGAALLMATARALLRAFLHTGQEPAAALGNLNAFLCEDMEEGRFMTLFYGDLDPKRRTLRYVRAGHNAPLLYRRTLDTFEELEAPGAALGMMRDYRFAASEEVRVGPGDVLLLFTDGILETMNGAREQLGIERMKDLVRVNRDRSALEICGALQAAADAFRGDAPRQDDLTVMVAKVVE